MGRIEIKVGPGEFERCVSVKVEDITGAKVYKRDSGRGTGPNGRENAPDR